MSEPVSTHRDVAADPFVSALNRISWGSIFAGVAMALAVQFLLNLLGIGIGAAVLDPKTSDNPEASTFSIAGGIWFVIAGIIASFIGGYIASRLSGRPSSATGGWLDDVGGHHPCRAVSTDDVGWRARRWSLQRIVQHSRRRWPDGRHGSNGRRSCACQFCQPNGGNRAPNSRFDRERSQGPARRRCGGRAGSGDWGRSNSRGRAQSCRRCGCRPRTFRSIRLAGRSISMKRPIVRASPPPSNRPSTPRRPLQPPSPPVQSSASSPSFSAPSHLGSEVSSERNTTLLSLRRQSAATFSEMRRPSGIIRWSSIAERSVPAV